MIIFFGVKPPGAKRRGEVLGGKWKKKSFGGFYNIEHGSKRIAREKRLAVEEKVRGMDSLRLSNRPIEPGSQPGVVRCFCGRDMSIPPHNHMSREDSRRSIAHEEDM